MRIFSYIPAVLLLAIPAYAQAGKSGPCSLLTKADVQQATGMTSTEGKPNPNNATVCDFKAGDTNAVGIMLQNVAPGDSMERTIAELKKRKIETTPVSGIGDKGYFASPGYGMQQLSVYKGSKFIIVTVFFMGMDQAKSRTVAEKLAKAAVPRM
jgi:hypothetical protein